MKNNSVRRHLIPVLILVGLVLSLALGCTPRQVATAPGGAPSGGRLVRAMTSEPATIDPQGTPSSGLSLVLSYLFDTLVVRDTDNEIHPLLAESWEVADDGTAVTMKLKEDVVFHDGTPVNAEAVRRTFERFKEVGTRSPIYMGVSEIETIEVVDDHTVRFTFAQPSAIFWSTISMPYAAIISPDSIDKVDAGEAEHLVGSGPFRLGDWERGAAMTLERNPDYGWGPPIVENQGPPHLSALVFEVIPDATTQLAALQTGEVDVLFVNRPEHVSELEDNADIRLERAVLNSLIYLGFNNQKPPLDQPEVRRALSYAVDKDEIVELALGGVGEVAFSPLPPTIEGFDPALEAQAIGHDTAEAATLLQDAGFEQGDDGTWQRSGEPLELKLLTSTRAPNGDIAALLQSQFKAIGVPLTIEQLDSKAVMQATSEGDYDLLLWRYDWNDPDALRVFFSGDRIGRTNRIYYSSPAFDALVEQGARELDAEARHEIYLKAQGIMLQEAPLQPLYHPVDYLAMRERVEGAEVGYMGRLLLNDARITE